MVKNIVLDMGNVLLSYNPRLPLAYYLESDADREIINKELFCGPEWIQGDLGYLTPEEMYDSISKRVPQRLHQGLKDCIEKWYQFLSPIAGAEIFLNRAKAKGLQLYLLSNASKTFYEYFPKEFDTGIFQGIVVSADVHMIKPGQEIFRYLLETYDLKAEECLFIDDLEENVIAARELGMEGEIFQDNFEEIALERNLW